jgi:glycosyltransferase involved in cell wall biosynthesis
MKISIAMATYNGAKYLQDQLDSFAAQTRLPDELVVCDDGSKDQTIEIIENFSRTVAFSVRIYRNETRLGYAQNFGQAMSLCTGDVTFLSDQDDYWFINKIETVTAIFNSDKNIWVVINDAQMTNDSLKPTGQTILGQMNLEKSNNNIYCHGCCSAYRKIINSALLPIPEEIVSHDMWLHQLGFSLNIRKEVTECLQYYRRHDKNVSPDSIVRKKPISLLMHAFSSKNLLPNPVEACNSRIIELLSFRQRLIDKKDFLSINLPDSSTLKNTIIKIENLIPANKIRKEILLKRLPLRFFLAINFYFKGGYKNFEGFKSFAKDMLR